MRARSGSVESSNPLVGFLYDLMVRHLTVGDVEELMSRQSSDRVTFTNGWAANYAKDVAARLLWQVPDRETATKPVYVCPKEPQDTVWGIYTGERNSEPDAHFHLSGVVTNYEEAVAKVNMAAWLNPKLTYALHGEKFVSDLPPKCKHIL